MVVGGDLKHLISNNIQVSIEDDMTVNNFDNLSLYFNKLKDKEDFYYVQIIQRKKDGHKKSERIIRNFYIYNKEDFLKKSI